MAKLSIRIIVRHECGTESVYNKTPDGQVFLKRVVGMGALPFL